MIPVKNGKSEHHYWILHIRISLGTKFLLKLTILIFLTKFAQKGNFRSKTEILHLCVRSWLLLATLTFPHGGRLTQRYFMSVLLLVADAINPLTTNVCIVNQFTGFYMIGNIGHQLVKISFKMIAVKLKFSLICIKWVAVTLTTDSIYKEDHFFIISLSLYSDVVHWMFPGNDFHMCTPCDLNLLFQNFIMFRDFFFCELRLKNDKIFPS